MTDLRCLVAAIDFSAGSRAALAQAGHLAARAGAALHVVHADVHYRSASDSLDDAALPDASPSSLLRMQAERFVDDVLAHDGEGHEGDPPHVTVSVVRGITAASAVLRYADRVDADLIVAGSHGRSALARLLVGSVAEALVAGAHCPVLTVPNGDSGTSTQGPVLVAVDLSERSRDALAAGRALAALLRAPLELAHVVADAGPYPSFASEMFAVVDADPSWEADALERLGQFAADGPRPDALHAVLGTPGPAIAALARDRGARLVVVATHGRTGIVSALVGSTATSVLRRVGCPVLSVDRPTSSTADRPQALRAARRDDCPERSPSL